MIIKAILCPLRIVFVSILIAGTLLVSCTTTHSSANPGLELGAGMFMFSGPSALEGDSLRVFYHRPTGDVETMPILFVMHGVNRNADTYRDNWIELSEKYKILVIVPEFTQELFPKSRAYNHGNLLTADGEKNPPDAWSFSLIDPIFDEVIRRTGSPETTYDLFGHSAGSQFAHRFFLFAENTKVDRVIASNAGTYTMLDFDIAYPFGLKGMELDEGRLRTLLGRHLVVQLGEADNDPDHPNLNVSDAAMMQGAHRFDRGINFYEKARNLADQLGVPFGWTLRTVPGVDHNNAEMAQDIAAYLSRDDSAR